MPPVQPFYITNVMYNEALAHGAKTVTTAGTAVALVSASTECKEVLIQAKGSNAGAVFIGGASVPNDYTGGIALNPYDYITLSADNLNKIYVNAATNGDGVTYLYWTPVS